VEGSIRGFSCARDSRLVIGFESGARGFDRCRPGSRDHRGADFPATLRNLGQRQQQYRVASADGGYVERAQARVAGYTVTAVAMHRLKSAAEPLINSLSDQQREAGMSVLQQMGVSF
jgi:hypothetical protein